MKTLIIFALIVLIGLAVIGAGPDSFIDNVGAAGLSNRQMFERMYSD